MEVNFCRRCGATLNASGHHYVCDNGHEIFPAPIPSSGLFLLRDGKLLLSVRGREPHKGMLDAFGGFVDTEETLEDSIYRELKEELGLDRHDFSTPQFLTSAVGKYPYGGEVITVLSSLFWATLSHEANPIPMDDVAEIVAIPIEDVDLAQLHDDDIRNSFIKLKEVLTASSR